MSTYILAGCLKNTRVVEITIEFGLCVGICINLEQFTPVELGTTIIL